MCIMRPYEPFGAVCFSCLPLQWLWGVQRVGRTIFVVVVVAVSSSSSSSTIGIAFCVHAQRV